MFGSTGLAAVAMAVNGVANRMLLTSTMQSTNLDIAKLIPLSINDQTITESESLKAGEAIKTHTGKYGSICFVVRRPG